MGDTAAFHHMETLITLWIRSVSNNRSRWVFQMWLQTVIGQIGCFVVRKPLGPDSVFLGDVRLYPSNKQGITHWKKHETKPISGI